MTARATNGRSEKGVGDAAVVFEGGDRAAKSPEHVEVGGFRGEGHGQGRVGGAAVEAGAGETGSGEEVGDWFHSALMGEYRVARPTATVITSPPFVGPGMVTILRAIA